MNLSDITGPIDRLRGLFHFGFSDTKEARIEDAILGAVADPAVTDAIGRVNSQRLAFVVRPQPGRSATT